MFLLQNNHYEEKTINEICPQLARINVKYYDILVTLTHQVT